MSGEWISVEDRLPEHNRIVPVRIEGLGIAEAMPGGPHYDHKLGLWFWFNGYGIGGGKVIAWRDA